MKNRIIFILLILICLPNYAQINEYIVITFETKRSIDKEAQKYYWIAPVDSINNTDFRLYPLYVVVGEYSKDNLDDCQKGDSIDIFVSTANTRLDFDNEYETKINNLISLIDNNRTKIQTININWTGNKKAKDTTTIFATPISGDFCNCFQYHNMIDEYFQSFIYLPLANFGYLSSFWQTSTASIVKFSNYNYIDYKSHLLHKRGVQNGAR